MTAPLTDTPKCPKCGETWLRWPTSALPAHARCVFAPDVQDEIYRRKLQAPPLSITALAVEYKTTTSIVRASIAEAMQRGGKLVSPWGR